MQQSFSSASGKAKANGNNTIFWLICLIICYQAAYQTWVSFTLSEDHSELDPWCNSGASDDQCFEVQIFRDWQSTGHDALPAETQKEVHDLLQPTGNATVHTEPSKHEPSSDIHHEVSTHAASSSPSSTGHIIQSVSSGVTSWGNGLISMQNEFEERMRHRHHHLAHSAIKEFHNMTQSRKDLQELHSRLGALASVGAGVPSSAPTDTMTAWSQDLSALQHRMEARMEMHNKAHEHIAELDARIATHRTHQESASSSAPALLDQIAALGKELCSGARHRNDPHCARFLPHGVTSDSSTRGKGRLRGAKSSALDDAEAHLNEDLKHLHEKQHDWEKTFVSKVSDVMSDFCSDPIHKMQPSCTRFLKEHPVQDSAATNMRAQKRAWHQKFASKIAHVGHDLCSDPKRQNYTICKKILGTGKADESKSDLTAQDKHMLANKQEQSQGHLSHEHLELHWNLVENWKESSKKMPHRSNATYGIEAFKADDLKKLRTSAHWSGRIPSVACVALIPDGKHARSWMKYFVDNFRLQRYEGDHQLVLVYQQGDQQSAELVHKYADGSQILSAVARGDDFPSAAAYRFGAWVARGADIIARWDFDAWHHPHRLSMQVRSLAASGRPAGLLERWTILNATGANATVQTGKYWDSTLIGEAGWMRKNWYPFMEEEHGIFEAHQKDEIVKIDAPDLVAFDESTK